MDEVVILRHHSVSAKGLKNCLDMKCSLDERPEQKGNLYTKRTASQSKRTFIKSGKLTSPSTSPPPTDSCFGEKNPPRSGFQGGFRDPESEHSPGSKQKSLSPNKTKFIQDMVDRFDLQGQCVDDKITSQKNSKMFAKAVLNNCDDAVFSKENEGSCSRRTHTRSENNSETVSSGSKLQLSKSLKPSPAPKPRKIAKDEYLFRNIVGGSTCTNVEAGFKESESENFNDNNAAHPSCTDVSGLTVSSASLVKPATSLSRSCSDLNRDVWSENSHDCVDKSLSHCKSEESSATDESAEEDVDNKADDSPNFEDDFDESDEEWENVNNSVLASQQAKCVSPPFMDRQLSSSSTKTLVARDSLNKKVIRVPSCDDLDVTKQLKVEYVNEAEPAKPLKVEYVNEAGPAKPKDLVGVASFVHENNTRSHQDDSQISRLFQISKLIEGPCVNVALRIGANVSSGDKTTTTASTSTDVDDIPYEIYDAKHGGKALSRSNEPSSEISSRSVGSMNEDTSNETAPKVIRRHPDPIQGSDLHPLALHPTVSPRLASPCGSPVLTPRKTSKGHIDGTLLSQVVLPPSPATRTSGAGSPAPPPVTPRIPARGSSCSHSTPPPSTLPRKSSGAAKLQHSKSRRVPPPPPPPIAEVPPVVPDPLGDLDAAPPSVPQRLPGHRISNAGDQNTAGATRPNRPRKGYETKCVEVDSGNPLKTLTRSALSSASSKSMNDLRKKVSNRGSTLSLHVPIPCGDEIGNGQVSPSRSEGYLKQSSDGYMPMGSQRSNSSSSHTEFSSPSNSVNDMNEIYLEHNPPSLPPRVATLRGRSVAMSYAASDTKSDCLNRCVMRDNSYLELRHDEEYDKYSYLSLYDESEPLYQHYHQGAVVRQVLEQNIDDDDDADCDSYYNPQDYIEHAKSRVDDILKRDSGNELLSREKVVKGLSTLENAAKLGSGFRKLWCEMPKVKESGLLDHMTPEERRLQESLFEILSSEASYLKSLNLLVGHFMEMLSVDIEDKDKSVLSKQDFNWLFSNARAVRSASIKMLEALEDVWQQGCVINALHLCKTVTEVVQVHYGVFVTYCSNAIYQERKLKELNERSPEFRYAVRRLEDCADCHSLPLSSFLALPMQRITRMPLLVTAMCRYLKPDDASSPEVTRCIHVLQKVVKQCNEGARKMSNLEHMNKIEKILDFRSVKKIPLISQSRHLVKKGFVTHIIPEPSGFLKKLKRNLFFFLFNDLLVITKKKSDKQFEVLEYSPRSHIHAQVISEETVSKCLPYGVPSGCRNLFSMALLDKHVEFILSCESQSEQLRWIQAVTPFEQDTGDEVVYTDWDCPQVQAVMQYLADEPDELSLEESDIVNVLRKINDGWYEGERIRDGERGWFPASHTVEIQNAHVRARNLRQQYQLMKNLSYGLSSAV